MERLAIISDSSEDFILIQQESAVFVVNQGNDYLIDLISGDCREIKEDMSGVIEGQRVEGVILTAQTACAIVDEVPIRNPDPEEVIRQVEQKREEPSCKFSVLSTNLSAWMLGDWETAEYRGVEPLPPPSLWEVHIQGQHRETFISRVKPQVLMYRDNYYVFVYGWDRAIHVYTGK